MDPEEASCGSLDPREVNFGAVAPEGIGVRDRINESPTQKPDVQAPEQATDFETEVLEDPTRFG